MLNKFDVNPEYPTPYYHYDMKLLDDTLRTLKNAADNYGYHVHYAMKANSNTEILNTVFGYGFGADCVSGNEVKKALSCGVDPESIVLAGVGKTDAEINLALEHNIFCLNVESLMELEVIGELAALKHKTARVTLRINPDIDAQTHKNITTGRKENKFGIALSDMDEAIAIIKNNCSLNLSGLHFHIGSQIMELTPYIELCNIVNSLLKVLNLQGITLDHVNLGGGIGINYHNPDIEPIPNFDLFFKTIHDHLKIDLPVHFELGRSIVGQCGSLVTRVLYKKSFTNNEMLILDAGMTELMRPALYQAEHKIEALRSSTEMRTYSVAGPVCESTDMFGTDIRLPETKRNDLLIIRSAGAYGESMANNYNLRQLHAPVYNYAPMILEN